MEKYAGRARLVQRLLIYAGTLGLVALLGLGVENWRFAHRQVGGRIDDDRHLAVLGERVLTGEDARVVAVAGPHVDVAVLVAPVGVALGAVVLHDEVLLQVRVIDPGAG